MAYGTIKADLLISSNGNVDLTSINTDNATTSADGYMSAADKTKLDGVEDNATADQTGAEIKSAYEGEADTNAFTDAEKTKLSNIEDSATADQTGAEIKSLYEGEADTNVLTDALQVKLATLPDNSTLTTTLAAKADLSGGKLDVSQLPDIAISEFKGAVADQTAMLAITGEKGDWVTRDDDGKVYVITGDDPTDNADWTALSYPTGFSGAYADLTGKPTLGTAAATDSTAYATAAQGTLADSATQPGDLATVATSGSYADLTNLPTLADASIYATAGITSTSLVWDAPTIEAVNIDGTTDAFASSNDVNIADGNVHYFTDAESATAVNTVNLRWDGSNSLDSKLSVGHSLSTTLIVASTDTTRAPSVIATIQIDGSTVTPLWQGNSAAPEDDAGGTTSSDNKDHDVYSLTIIKTASATFTVLAARVRYGLVPD